jgi:hypothetical protein
LLRTIGQQKVEIDFLKKNLLWNAWPNVVEQ